MKYCTYCGKQIEDNAKFCPYCGHQAKQVKRKAPKQPFEARVENTPNAKPAHAPIQSVPFLDQCTSHNKTSLYVIIYSALLLIVSFVIYQFATHLSSLDSSDELSNTLNGLKAIPFFYYVILIGGIVVLALAVYRYLRNQKAYIYLTYAIGLGINTLLLLHIQVFMKAIRILNEVISSVHSSGIFAGAVSAYSYESELKSIASTIEANQSNYKATIVIMILIAIALLVISIISMLQKRNMVKVHPFFDEKDN